MFILGKIVSDPNNDFFSRLKLLHLKNKQKNVYADVFPSAYFLPGQSPNVCFIMGKNKKTNMHVTAAISELALHWWPAKLFSTT